MNFLALGAKSLRKAEKKRLEVIRMNHKYQDTLGLVNAIDPDAEFQRCLDEEYTFMTRAMDIGLSYFAMAKARLATETSDRPYMITIRPPHDTNWILFKNTTETFINKWKDSWTNYEYAFEQKGETIDDVGKGFHVHIIITTNKTNYYPSHILRDAKKAWDYVGSNCIQVDTLKNLAKAKGYIRGDKAQEKQGAVAMDSIWREKIGIKEIYEKSGQVHPLFNESYIEDVEIPEISTNQPAMRTDISSIGA